MNPMDSVYKPVSDEIFNGIVLTDNQYSSWEDFFENFASQQWITSVGSNSETITYIRKYFQQDVDDIIQRANSVLNNRFILFGNKASYLGARIDWHLDFNSGRIWKKDFFLNVPLMFWGDYSDAKVPWQLSRFQYLLDLALAYKLYGQTKYKQKFEYLIDDWVNENPYPFGINWVNPMEASIRAINWLAAFEIFGHENFERDFKIRFLKNLFQHSIYIFNNLERYGPGINNNHYLYDLIGLLVLGRLFGFTEEGKQWYSFAKNELETEINAQIGSDGICYGSSLGYQINALELFLFAFLFEKHFNQPFTENYILRLRESFDALRHLRKPDNTLANFGDCGSDRLFVIDSKDEHDPTHIMDLAEFVLDKYRECNESPSLYALLLSGTEDFRLYNEKLTTIPGKRSSVYFSISGISVLRNENNYLSFFANPVNTTGYNDYKHNDILSFVYSYQDENIVVDSGTFVFTGDPKGRNYFRKTSSHSTIEIDSREINRFLPKLLFSVRRDAEINEVDWESNENYDYISAEHSGYSRLEEPVIVKRSIHFDKHDSIYLFKDNIYGSGYHNYASNIILDSDIRPNLIDNKAILKTASNKITVIILSSDNWTMEKIPHYISKSYGVREESWKLRMSCSCQAPVKCLWGLFSVDNKNEIESKIAVYENKLSTLGWKDKKYSKLVLKKHVEIKQDYVPDKIIRRTLPVKEIKIKQKAEVE